jgi:uncharacterized protein YjiS (DUF1127 family)
MSPFFTNLFFTGRPPAEARIGSALFGRLRDRWAIRRTRLSIAHLSDSQLRDIGLVRDDPAAHGDAHRGYWQEHLGFTGSRQGRS